MKQLLSSASIIIIAVAILATAGFFVWQNQHVALQTVASSVSPGVPTPSTVVSVAPMPVDTSNWKTYQNDKFGFQFKYPAYAKVCDIPPAHDIEKDTVLDLAISMSGNCKWENFYGLVSADIFIGTGNVLIQDGQIDSGNLEDDFYRDGRIYGLDRSLNPNLGYVTIDGLRGYGGAVKKSISGAQEYLVFLRVRGHTTDIWDRNYSAHSKETTAIVNSLRFDAKKYPR